MDAFELSLWPAGSMTIAARLGADDRSLAATRLRGMVFGHRDRVEADGRRELHGHGWRRLFAEFDAAVCPITPTPAFPHDHTPDPREGHPRK